MATFTSRANVFNKRGKGGSVILPMHSVASSGGLTAATLTSGSQSLSFVFNLIGTTLPSTIVPFKLPPAPNAPMNLTFAAVGGVSGGHTLYLARLYKLGTLVLTSTGNQFTHDAATFPVTRTQFGVATQPVSLIPILNVTTALTTTAAQLKLANVAASNGYTNQDGNTVVGATTFTFPSATTAVNSAFIPMLEKNSGQGAPYDSGVQDITNINITVASATGACDVWGMEIIAPFGLQATGLMTFMDGMFGGLGMQDVAPAAPTSGTLTSQLGIVFTGGGVGGNNLVGFAEGVLNS